MGSGELRPLMVIGSTQAVILARGGGTTIGRGLALSPRIVQINASAVCEAPDDEGPWCGIMARPRDCGGRGSLQPSQASEVREGWAAVVARPDGRGSGEARDHG